ncbi:unnamed protein product [Gadus morhua 'NCC']
MGRASRLQLSRTPASPPQPDTPDDHPNQHFLLIYSGFSITHGQIVYLHSCPDLTTTARFLHFMAPGPTRLASCINQPLLIPSK